MLLLVDAQTWVNAFNVWALLHAPAFAGQLWSVDGKSIKGPSVGGNSSAQAFVTLVSVYGQPVGVVPLALLDNAKVSEIEVAKRLLATVTTAPSLAQSLPLGFSLDALHAQVEPLARLNARAAHDLVGLKANQKKLYQQMQQLAQQTLPLSQTTQMATLHDRQTQRTVNVYAAPLALPNRWVKAGLTRIIWVCRQGIRNGQPFQAHHGYVSNLNLEAPAFLDLSRSHWQIENGLHWVKDVTLKEDDPPRRGGFAPMS